MPNLFLADMVRELSSSSGTGAFTLDGPTPGHRAFAAAIPANATFPYAICGVSDESQWETGEGTLSPSGQLIRTPKASSAGGALLNFGAGLKTVALTLTADWAGAVAAAADQPVDLADVTGLVQALAGKQNDLTANPNTNFITSQDSIALIRNSQIWNAGGSNLFARRTAGGPFSAEGNAAVGGRITGGFGAASTNGVLDWNDTTNAVAGSGATLLTTTAANSPPAGALYHPFAFEYGPSKTGMGNLTQFAVPYYDASTFFGFRTRFSGVWSVWRSVLTENTAGQYLPAADNVKALGSTARRFSVVYAGSGSINTSDERQKADIGPVPEEWLDAWGDVEWCRFHFKGGKRWHVGLIAQHVYAAFAKRGLDAFTIGLCCYDEWPEQRETVLDDDGNAAGEGEVIENEGDLWGLRYDECFAMEAAWVRRELARLHSGKSDRRSRKNDG